MYKSKTSFSGYALLAFMVASEIGVFTFMAIRYPSMSLQEHNFLLYGGPFIAVCFSVAQWRILSGIKSVEITKTTITIQWTLLSKTKIIQRADLSGYRDRFAKVYRIFLIDKNDAELEEIRKPFFRDFQELIDALQLPYLGKQPLLIGKLFKTKKI